MQRQVSYPSSLVSEEGFKQGLALTLLTKEARETLAAKYFRGFTGAACLLPLPILPGVDPEKSGYYCNGTVRYIEAYSMHWDAMVGRLDLLFEDDDE
jgi:hypothetical protein